MDDPKTFRDFLELSQALTGIGTKRLDQEPRLKSIYWSKIVLSGYGDQGEDLLAEFRDRRKEGEPDEQIAAALLDGDRQGLARTIIKMWLVGSWYPPDGSSDGGCVIDQTAYKEGLVWQIAQAHPMGHSPYQYGYWENRPNPLRNFIGDPPGGGTWAEE